MSADLEGLVRRAAQGDRDAQNALILHVDGPVRAAIRRRLSPGLRRRADTDDIFQATITSALSELPGLEWRGEREFLAWLGQIAEHRVLDAARLHGAARRDVRREAGLTAADGVPVQATSPTQSAMRAEATVAIRSAVARLPDVERTVLELRSAEGLSFEEIASRTGLPDRFAARRTYMAAVRRVSRIVDSDE